MRDYIRYAVKCLIAHKRPASVAEFNTAIETFTATYSRHYGDYADQQLNAYPELSASQRQECRDRWVRQWIVMATIEDLVNPQKTDPCADNYAGFYDGDNEPGNNDRPFDGSGAREPRRPLSPLLSGSAARAYPPTEPPNWAAM